jgi:kynurenine formamidase
MEIKKIIDLSVTMRDGMPVWPGNNKVKIEVMVSPDGHVVERYSSITHSGTHVDAPLHFIPGGSTVDRIPLETLIGDGFVIRPEPEGDEITAKSLGKVWKDNLDGNIILINTGWDVKRSFSREFQEDFPGLSEDAADFLIDHGVKFLGIDTLGIEPYSHRDFPVHKILLEKNIPFIEDLCNLQSLQEGKKYMIVALPLKIGDGSGSMARVVALDIY